MSKVKYLFFTSRRRKQGTATIRIRQNQAPTVKRIQSLIYGIQSQSFRFSQEVWILFGPTLGRIHIGCLLDISLLRFTVAGASCDSHTALAFVKGQSFPTKQGDTPLPRNRQNLPWGNKTFQPEPVPESEGWTTSCYMFWAEDYLGPVKSPSYPR